MPRIGYFDTIKFRFFVRTDTEGAASVPHGVVRIEYQVHQDLPKRAGIGPDRKLCVNIQNQIDFVFGEISPDTAKNIIQQR